MWLAAGATLVAAAIAIDWAIKRQGRLKMARGDMVYDEDEANKILDDFEARGGVVRNRAKLHKENRALVAAEARRLKRSDMRMDGPGGWTAKPGHGYYPNMEAYRYGRDGNRPESVLHGPPGKRQFVMRGDHKVKRAKKATKKRSR